MTGSGTDMTAEHMARMRATLDRIDAKVDAAIEAEAEMMRSLASPVAALSQTLGVVQ